MCARVKSVCTPSVKDFACCECKQGLGTTVWHEDRTCTEVKR